MVPITVKRWYYFPHYTLLLRQNDFTVMVYQHEITKNMIMYYKEKTPKTVIFYNKTALGLNVSDQIIMTCSMKAPLLLQH